VTELAFHHVGVVTRELDASVKLYVALGYEASPIYEDPVQKARIVLMRRDGSPMIELIFPLAADSAAAGWLKRIKAGPYHTCYVVPEIGHASARLRELGFAPLSEPVPAVAFESRFVVFLWSNDVGLIELLEASPR
jgi:methylmalonyl-CoA/ethylmalonyl-CoA epimerase